MLAGGRGAWFRDASGNRYLDMGSVAINANAGHNHPRILDAMRRQLDEPVVAGPSMTTRIREEAGRRLSRVTPPGLDRFLFTLGGADANEHAYKMACLITGRRKVICRKGSYHGTTYGAMSFSDDPRVAPFMPGLAEVTHAGEPYCFRCAWGTTPDVCDRPCVGDVTAAIEREEPSTIAAVLMETIPGTSAGYIPPPDYYARIRRICDDHGILLILDEVLTGFGRTGRWFAADHYAVVPDMMTLGKGITSGHAPLGAVAVNGRVADHFEREPLLTGMTHTAHPISLAAAVGNLDAFEQEDLVERSRRLGEVLSDWLRGAAARHVAVDDVRSMGLYGCLEMAAGVDPGRLREEAFRRGIHLLARGRCLYVAPPLVIGETDLLGGLEILESVLP